LQAALDRGASDDRRAELRAYCAGAPAGCFTGPDGTFADPHAASLEAAADARGERAHRLLVAGQLSLIATGVLFVIDLVHGSDGPDNIPYSGLRWFARGDRVGLQARF